MSSLLAGHLGFDYIPGALLHDEARAVQTLPKVSPVSPPVFFFVLFFTNGCMFVSM